MKAEYTAEDFKNAVRNPFFEKLNKKVEVSVRNEDYKIFLDVAERDNVKPEEIMRRCLLDYAALLKEHE